MFPFDDVIMFTVQPPCKVSASEFIVLCLFLFRWSGTGKRMCRITRNISDTKCHVKKWLWCCLCAGKWWVTALLILDTWQFYLYISVRVYIVVECHCHCLSFFFILSQFEHINQINLFLEIQKYFLWKPMITAIYSNFVKGRMTEICVGKLTIPGSDNGLSHGRRQAINWTKS